MEFIIGIDTVTGELVISINGGPNIPLRDFSPEVHAQLTALGPDTAEGVAFSESDEAVTALLASSAARVDEVPATQGDEAARLAAPPAPPEETPPPVTGAFAELEPDFQAYLRLRGITEWPVMDFQNDVIDFRFQDSLINAFNKEQQEQTEREAEATRRPREYFQKQDALNAAREAGIRNPELTWNGTGWVIGVGDATEGQIFEEFADAEAQTPPGHRPVQLTNGMWIFERIPRTEQTGPQNFDRLIFDAFVNQGPEAALAIDRFRDKINAARFTVQDAIALASQHSETTEEFTSLFNMLSGFTGEPVTPTQERITRDVGEDLFAAPDPFAGEAPFGEQADPNEAVAKFNAMVAFDADAPAPSIGGETEVPGPFGPSSAADVFASDLFGAFNEAEQESLAAGATSAAALRAGKAAAADLEQAQIGQAEDPFTLTGGGTVGQSPFDIVTGPAGSAFDLSGVTGLEEIFPFDAGNRPEPEQTPFDPTDNPFFVAAQEGKRREVTRKANREAATEGPRTLRRI